MPASSATRVNDFSIKIATVNGTGSASANTLLMKSIFRSGIPVTGKNYFPSNIQGLPTWYEIRVTRDGYAARSGQRRHHGRDERGDLRARREGGRPRGLPGIRLDLAAPLAAEARGHHRARRAAGAAVQRELQRRAHAHPDEEHLLRRRAGGAAGPGPDKHPRAAGGDLREEAAAGRQQHEGHPARLRLRARELHLPAAAACAEAGAHRRARPDRRQYRRGARGACSPAPPWRRGTRSRPPPR